MGFPPEPLFLLLDGHALGIYYLIISLLFVSYKAHWRKSSKRGRDESCYEPVHNIGGILPSPKDPLTLEEKSCLVYQVRCFDCDFVYSDRLNGTLNQV